MSKNGIFLKTDVKKVEKVVCYHNAHNSKKWLNIYGNNFFYFFTQEYFGFSDFGHFKNVQNRPFLKTLQITCFFLTENIWMILIILFNP